MKYYIDQSGKIEDTAKDTVIAFSNSQIGAVILSAKDKRRLQEMFRRTGEPQLFVDYVFSALLILLLKPLKVNNVIVDLEYPGHTKIIDFLVSTEIMIDIEWKCIGKSSQAHDIAYKVFAKKLKIARKVTAGEILKLVKKITGGRLKIGLSPTNRRSAPVNKYIITHKNKKSRVTVLLKI